VIPTRFAEALGLPEEDVEATYWSTLFFGAGCIGTSFELSSLFGDDIAFRRDAFELDESSIERLRYVIGRAGSDKNGFGK